MIKVTVINTGTTCLSGGWDFFYERLRDDGRGSASRSTMRRRRSAWSPSPRTTTEHDALVFEELQRGRHRLVKTVFSPTGPLTLTAELDVVG